MFRNVTLSCLTEIAGVTVSEYKDVFINMFINTITQLEHVRMPFQINHLLFNLSNHNNLIEVFVTYIKYIAN